jgi:hypothetical protein
MVIRLNTSALGAPEYLGRSYGVSILCLIGANYWSLAIMKFQRSRAKYLYVELFQSGANFQLDDLDFDASSQNCQSSIHHHCY